MKKIRTPTAGLIFLLATMSMSIFAQNKPIQISINSIRTDLNQAALKLGIQYIQSLDTLWNKDHFRDWDKSLLSFTPEFNVETGNNDAFSSISGKVSGFFMFFDTIRIAGQITPRTDKIFHTLPASAGFETSNAFQTINGMIELGYVPWYQMPTANVPKFLKHTTFGLFLQGGYKFATDTIGMTIGTGGNTDESAEEVSQPILRAKARFSIDTKNLFVDEKKSKGFAIIGTSDTWYDLLNDKIYYRIEGIFRVFLTSNHFFDFTYERGSGAPNFNQGDQFGVGLTFSL